MEYNGVIMAKTNKMFYLEQETIEKLDKMADKRQQSAWIENHINHIFSKRMAHAEIKMVPCENDGCNAMIRKGLECPECKQRIQKEKTEKKLAKARERLSDTHTVLDPNVKKMYEDYIKKHGGEEDAVERPIKERPRRVVREQEEERGTGETKEGERDIESTEGERL